MFVKIDMICKYDLRVPHDQQMTPSKKDYTYDVVTFVASSLV